MDPLRLAAALLVTLACATPALARGARQGDPADALKAEVTKVARKVDRLAPETSPRRERLLCAWEAARTEALRVIFDTSLYPDADHGRVGQPLVDEKVGLVRALAAELEPLARKDLAAPLGLPVDQARALLADALRLEARAAELGVELAPLSTGGLLLLAARADQPLDLAGRAAPSAWELLLAQRVRDAAVLRANQELLRGSPVGAAPSRDELEQSRVLNEYRQLLGRPALRLDPRLVQSARGHALDMERLGFFDHDSPLPGKATCVDRMQAAGYPAPGGENIAMGHGSPQAAHDGWYRSSGHHRNMLSLDYAAVGTGRAGKHWVQNFGR
jgi:hypothetical protein